MVSEISAHHGKGVSIAEQSSSHHSGQERETEWERERKRRRKPALASFLRAGLFFHSVNPLWKCLHKYTQKCALLIF
jgi:hypothetical protein